ncbi:DNA-binding protein [Fulvimonas sp. R45]|uniref:DNA-binding protein n=1 Tax=Fulvimonas sp. R45 TaxID=3045937 RepID=UPI00265FE33A|nr:DNA-binding protein [Fulvimonas sp. R45]MDO1530339.1 DNA-binding protein [Fulvimonas sp. R45]
MTDFLFQDTHGSHIVSPGKVAQLLGLSPGDLASAAGVHQNTLTACPQSPRVQAFLRDIVNVLNEAKETFGDDELPIAWLLNEPLSAFRKKSAWELIAMGRGQDVLAYLHSYSAGFVG